MSDFLQPHGLQPIRFLCPWDFPGKSAGVGCHFLLQGIFPTQESNPGLLHCRQTLYRLSHWLLFLCFVIFLLLLPAVTFSSHLLLTTLHIHYCSLTDSLPSFQLTTSQIQLVKYSQMHNTQIQLVKWHLLVLQVDFNSCRVHVFPQLHTTCSDASLFLAILWAVKVIR